MLSFKILKKLLDNFLKQMSFRNNLKLCEKNTFKNVYIFQNSEKSPGEGFV